MESPSFPWASRNATAAADISKMLGRLQIDCAIQTGDQTTNALISEFNAYKAWKPTLNLPSGIPFLEEPGNHDLIGNNASGTPDLVTPAQWAEIFGRSAKDYFLDIGENLRVILVSPAADATVGQAKVRRLTVDAATVDWIEATVRSTTRRCAIFFHAPLEGTVGPYDGSAFSSYDERWRAHYDPSRPLYDLIASNPNIDAWISGHTHSRINEVDIVKRVQYGDNVFAAVSSISPSFWNPGGPNGDPIITTFISIRPDRVEVRYRNHSAAQWIDPVHTVHF